MASRFRKFPTTEGSKALRAALASQGIKARVATQRYAYRVISDDDRALPALIALGFEGPIGGAPSRNGLREFYAYEFAA